jgi:lysophospholipase L1-like esterase
MTSHQELTFSAPRRRLRRFVLPVLLLALLAGALAGDVLLYQQASDSYRRLSETELDPYGLKHPHFPADAPAARELPVLLFFGDSRALYWPAPPVAGWRVINRGIGGQTTEQVRGRFDANVTPASPRILVLQAGINDLKAIPLLPWRRDEIVGDCKANLHEIVARARAAGATVIVSTIFPPGEVPLERKPQWSPDIEKAVEEVNADLRSMASDRVIVFDSWKILEDHGRLRDGYGLDTLHLSPAGYEALNAQLQNVLAAQATQLR